MTRLSSAVSSSETSVLIGQTSSLTSKARRTELPTPGTYILDPTRSSLTFTTKHLFGLGTVRGSFTVGSAEIQVAEPHAASVVRATLFFFATYLRRCQREIAPSSQAVQL